MDSFDKMRLLTIFDQSQRAQPCAPDGQPKKCIDTSRAKTDLATGLQKTIDWYRKNQNLNSNH